MTGYEVVNENFGWILQERSDGFYLCPMQMPGVDVPDGFEIIYYPADKNVKWRGESGYHILCTDHKAAIDFFGCSEEDLEPRNVSIPFPSCTIVSLPSNFTLEFADNGLCYLVPKWKWWTDAEAYPNSRLPRIHIDDEFFPQITYIYEVGRKKAIIKIVESKEVTLRED